HGDETKYEKSMQYSGCHMNLPVDSSGNGICSIFVVFDSSEIDLLIRRSLWKLGENAIAGTRRQESAGRMRGMLVRNKNGLMRYFASGRSCSLTCQKTVDRSSDNSHNDLTLTVQNYNCGTI